MLKSHPYAKKERTKRHQTGERGQPIKTEGITSQREWLRVVDDYIRGIKEDPLYTPKQKQRALHAIRSIGRHAIVLDKFHYEVMLF